MKCLSCGAEDAKPIATEALDPARSIYQCRVCQWVFIASCGTARDDQPREKPRPH